MPTSAPPYVYLEVFLIQGAESYALVLVFFLSRYKFAILYEDLSIPQNLLIHPQHNDARGSSTFILRKFSIVSSMLVEPHEYGFPLGEKSITPTSVPVRVANFFASSNKVFFLFEKLTARPLSDSMSFIFQFFSCIF